MAKHRLPEFIENPGELCEYGCGQVAHYQLLNGKWCCSERYHKCPVKKKIQSKAQKGRDDLIESGKRLGKSNKGRKASFEVRQKLSVIQKEIANKDGERENRRQQQLDYHSRLTTDEKKEYRLKRVLTISKIKKRYPLFSKVEEIRYNPNKPREKEIQVHCKNHNCINSKEKGGWFSPTGREIEQRILAIELDHGNGAGYIYCSEECKQTCPLYGKSVKQLIKEDQINAGIIEDPWYTSAEYLTWRNYILELDLNSCQWCGKSAEHVHHIMPKKIYPNLALDPDNGISCCQECHFKYGHRDSWCTTKYLSKLVCERILRIEEKIHNL